MDAFELIAQYASDTGEADYLREGYVLPAIDQINEARDALEAEDYLRARNLFRETADQICSAVTYFDADENTDSALLKYLVTDIDDMGVLADQLAELRHGARMLNTEQPDEALNDGVIARERGKRVASAADGFQGG